MHRQGRNLGSALGGGYVGTMPDGICIARRKVFFSGTFNFFRQPNFLDNQKKTKKNATHPLTSPCTGPYAPPLSEALITLGY